MSTIPTRKVAGIDVGAVGAGLMNFTWKPVVTPDEQAFKAIKAAIDSVAAPGLAMLNSGEFYGVPPHREANLDLLSRFFAAEPEYSKRVFLSVKGALSPEFKADCTLEGLRRSVENINKRLGGRKMDLFEPARRDLKVSVEETMKNLQTLVDEGHFQHIGLSEVNAESIRAAAAVGKVAAVEVEYSPWAVDIEQNGILDACKELDIPVIAYSPLGRGFLTGKIKSRADLPKGDSRADLDKFSEENFDSNMELVRRLTTIAETKGVSPAQLAVAWVLAQWPSIIPIPGSTRPEGVVESFSATNITLSEAELAAIRKVIDSTEIRGGRYHEHAAASLNL